MSLLEDIPTLSDTELRIILIALASTRAITMKEMQIRTGRGRQVYDAVKSLEQKGKLTRTRALQIGELAWMWITPYRLPKELAPEPTPTPEQEPLVLSPVISTPKTKAATRVKAPKQPKESPPVHPAVAIYNQIAKRRCQPVIAEQIIATVTDIPKWEAAIRDYILQGWNPLNVAGMLRLYTGEMSIKGRKKQYDLSIPSNVPAHDTKRQWEEYLLSEGGNDDS